MKSDWSAVGWSSLEATEIVSEDFRIEQQRQGSCIADMYIDGFVNGVDI